MARVPLRFTPLPGDKPLKPWKPGDPRPRFCTPEDGLSVATPEGGQRRSTREARHG